MSGAEQPETGRRVFIETFGCQMNVLDSELVQDQLRALGYGFVAKPDDADIVLYNTCSVRELSEHKVVSRLGVLRQRKATEPELIVGVLGCMAERAGADLVKQLPQVDLVCGPSELDRVPALLESLTAERAETREAQLALSGHNDRRSKKKKGPVEIIEADSEDRLEALDRARHTAEGAAQAYVRITRGCNKFCSFCIVPFTRGEEVHRDPDAIVDEVRRLARAGAREVTLLGQTINHYHHGDTDFATLLKRAHDEVPELPRLRFLTSYPRDFTDAALDVMASSERMSRWLHIPAQSGSNEVLKRMNRGYTREAYLDLIARAKARMPDVSIVGDMIVGFPGETEEDFQASLSLLDEVQYKTVYVFKYSPRPGTVAAKKLDDTIPLAEKKRRNNAMLAHQQAISLRHHQAMVGGEVEVIVEGAAKIDPKARADGLVSIGKPKARTRLSGRTRGDHIVAFDGTEDLVGQLVKVRVTEARELSLSGELVA